MTFSRRLRLFLIGVVIGSVIMYFYVLKERNIYKTPKEVIKEKLTRFPLQISNKALCQLNCNETDTALLRKEWAKAEIDLSKSEVREKPCPRYYITLSKPIGKTKILECSLCEEFAVLQQILESEECGCN
ncbi:MAG: hypothetical protein IT238_01650 [Bacteroidia bacterium]|nr:hypothetical protein [Bacteroidia bacterium]MCZ2247680.1 hypothetical protein [Bacteroidia bacterium]